MSKAETNQPVFTTSNPEIYNKYLKLGFPVILVKKPSVEATADQLQNLQHTNAQNEAEQATLAQSRKNDDFYFKQS